MPILLDDTPLPIELQDLHGLDEFKVIARTLQQIHQTRSRLNKVAKYIFLITTPAAILINIRSVVFASFKSPILELVELIEYTADFIMVAMLAFFLYFFVFLISALFRTHYLRLKFATKYQRYISMIPR